jgi:MoaA/NifB/PqqE/SkfB family radical SAM enzyme
MTLEKAARIAACSLVPNRPYHVQWLLTRKCNYRCGGCDVWREQDVDELSTGEIKKGLDVLKKLGVIEIVFSGGNPLLRDDIGEILEYASRFFVTTVYDNGSMAVKKIDALRCADFTAISLDTLDARRNDFAKGVEGSWNRAMDAVETLHEEGVSVGVSPTISQLNLHEIVGFTNYFLEKEIPVWYCLYSYDNSVDSTQVFKIGRKNHEFEIVETEAMVELCRRLVDLKKGNSNLLITAKILRAMERLFLDGERTWKCRALQNFFVIDHLGRVAGCHLRSPVASIFDLPKVWNSSQFCALRKTYRECTGCTYLCYIFYSLHGSVLGNIQVAQEKWKSAKLILKKNGLTPLSLAKRL